MVSWSGELRYLCAELELAIETVHTVFRFPRPAAGDQVVRNGKNALTEEKKISVVLSDRPKLFEFLPGASASREAR